MLDVITIGNATLDVFVHVHPRVFRGNICFLPGSKVEAEAVDFFTGGGAGNVAVGLSRLGLKTGIIAVLGSDQSSKIIVDELKGEKVSTALISFSKKNSTPYSVILTGFHRDRIVLTYSGAVKELATGKPIKFSRLDSKWLYVSSFHSPPNILKKIFSHAREKGIKTAYNPGTQELKSGRQKFSGIAKGIDVLLMNSSEALMLTGSADIGRNLHVLSEIAKIAVITDGPHGVHAADGNYMYFKNAFDVEVLDTTGAGDAFNAGFIAALIQGKPVEEAIDWGTANSNSVIQYLGTKNILLSKAGIKKFLSKYKSNRTTKMKI